MINESGIREPHPANVELSEIISNLETIRRLTHNTPDDISEILKRTSVEKGFIREITSETPNVLIALALDDKFKGSMKCDYVNPVNDNFFSLIRKKFPALNTRMDLIYDKIIPPTKNIQHDSRCDIASPNDAKSTYDFLKNIALTHQFKDDIADKRTYLIINKQILNQLKIQNEQLVPENFFDEFLKSAPESARLYSKDDFVLIVIDNNPNVQEFLTEKLVQTFCRRSGTTGEFIIQPTEQKTEELPPALERSTLEKRFTNLSSQIPRLGKTFQILGDATNRNWGTIVKTSYDDREVVIKFGHDGNDDVIEERRFLQSNGNLKANFSIGDIEISCEPIALVKEFEEEFSIILDNFNIEVQEFSEGIPLFQENESRGIINSAIPSEVALLSVISMLGLIIKIRDKNLFIDSKLSDYRVKISDNSNNYTITTTRLDCTTSPLNPYNMMPITENVEDVLYGLRCITNRNKLGSWKSELLSQINAKETWNIDQLYTTLIRFIIDHKDIYLYKQIHDNLEEVADISN